jgi:DNA polymerase III epsilon subunit-like protein
VSRYFGIEIENRHRAGADALATARILVRLLERASEQGARTVDDLTRVPAARTRRKSASPGWVGEI